MILEAIMNLFDLHENPCPVNIGDRILVSAHFPFAESKVSAISWKPSEARWEIELSWSIQNEFIGKSKVYSSDYKKSFFKYNQVN